MADEFIRPGADTTLDGWTDQAGGTTNIYATLDETTAADADFVQSPTITASQADLKVRLLQGSTQIVEWTHSNVSDTFTDAAQTLTSPQLAAISDFNDLNIELDDNAGSVYKLALGNPSGALTAPVVVRYRYKKLLAGAVYDADTTAWIAAVVTAGGTVSDTQKTRIDTLITGLKADGLFSLGRLWIQAGEIVAAQSLIDVCDLAVATLPVAPTLGATGYTGNGSTQYINFGSLPSDYTQNSASYGAYNLRNSTTTNLEGLMGVSGVAALCYADLGALYDGSGGFGRVNSDGGAYISFGNTNRRGMFLNSRRGQNDAESYYNGASAGVNTSTSPTVDFSGGFYGLARNNAGSADAFSTDIIAAAWIGAGLDDTQASNLSSRINAYMTSWGINVY